MVIACAGVVLKRVTLDAGRLSRESTGREVSISPPSCLKWAAIARVIAWEPPLASGHPPVWAAPQKIRARAEVETALSGSILWADSPQSVPSPGVCETSSEEERQG